MSTRVSMLSQLDESDFDGIDENLRSIIQQLSLNRGNFEKKAETEDRVEIANDAINKLTYVC